jgi:phenylacetate-CoA ligase
LFSAYHLNEETAPDYLEQMRRSGVRWLHGYPSMVALIAGHSLQTGIRLDLGWVTLGSENVLPQQAALIREAFAVEPREHYGMAEAVANISGCPEGRMHVDEDFAALELVPADAGRHSIIGTNFSNPAFPLLRYDTGDVATVTGLSCSCGRPGRVVDSIDGRQEDYVITRAGVRLGRLDHIFKDLINVREAQIRQSEPGRMVLCIVRGPRYGEQDERMLRRETAKRVGDEIDFDIEYVESLPRTRMGKLRFVVSSVPQGRLGPKNQSRR